MPCDKITLCFLLRSQCLFLLLNEPHICLDGRSIERVNSYKCQGVQVDETLSWKAHISEVIGKVAKIQATQRRLRPICHQITLLTIYKSLILLHLDFCSALSGCIGNGLSQKLEKLQNRAARMKQGLVGMRDLPRVFMPLNGIASLTDVQNN